MNILRPKYWRDNIQTIIITKDQETRGEEDGNEIPSVVPDDVPKIVTA
jgi:hypothetical protein